MNSSLENIEKFRNKVAMGLDYGSKKTGIALYKVGVDPFPTPYQSILTENTDQLIKEILQVVKMEDIELIIIGRPVYLNGNTSKMTNHVTQFMQRLSSALGEDFPIFQQDEDLTSFEAKTRINKGKKKIKKDFIDQVAATIILEDFFSLNFL